MQIFRFAHIDVGNTSSGSLGLEEKLLVQILSCSAILTCELLLKAMTKICNTGFSHRISPRQSFWCFY